MSSFALLQSPPLFFHPDFALLGVVTKRLWLSMRCHDDRYCFAVLGASCFMNIYLSINVAIARKKYNVQVCMASRVLWTLAGGRATCIPSPPTIPPPHTALCCSPRMHCSFPSAHARAMQYPALYAPPGHKNELEFNSVQRAHQNTLESYGPVMVQMMACGLKYPVTAAVCGALYVFGRVIYGYGYAKGTQTRVNAPFPGHTVGSRVSVRRSVSAICVTEKACGVRERERACARVLS